MEYVHFVKSLKDRSLVKKGGNLLVTKGSLLIDVPSTFSAQLGWFGCISVFFFFSVLRVFSSSFFYAGKNIRLKQEKQVDPSMTSQGYIQ